MDGYHPERPPRRAVNQPQKYQPLHSAGLLVDVVRTLTTSPSQAQKELQKEKLEKDYASTSEAINRLIDEHHDDLTLVLQSFRRLSTNVKTARERIRMVKNNLSSCQMLLRCKRDELKKLWLESAEHKYVVKLLEQLETVKSSYTELVEFIENKNYLHAAELLTVSQMTLDGNLKEMESLKDLRCMFDECRHALFEKILSEISEQLYNKPALDVLNQVGRAAAAGAGTVSELSKVNDLPLGNTTIDYVSIVNQRPVLSDNGCSLEDLKDEDRFNKPVQRLSTLVDALGWLDQLQQAVARIESQMDDRLWTVLVNGTTKFIRDHLHGSASATGDCRSLAELMRLLFVQFRATASVFQVLVKQMERVHQYRGRVLHDHFDVPLIWDRIQATMERLLDLYLLVDTDVSGGGAGGGGGPGRRQRCPRDGAVAIGVGPTELSESAEMSVYFARKPTTDRTAWPARGRRLFKFDSTAFAQAYRDEQLAAGREGGALTDRPGETHTLCPAGLENAKAIIFRLTSKFIAEVERHCRGCAQAGAPAASCRLRVHFDNYVRRMLLPTLNARLSDKVRTVLLDREDAWSRSDQNADAKFQLPPSTVPLFVSSLKTLHACRDVETALLAAPAFCGEFFQLWLQAVQLYRQAASRQYDRLTCATCEEATAPKRTNPRTTTQPAQEANTGRRPGKISSAWAIDGDIGRLLKSLPNWQNLTSPSATVDQQSSSSSAVDHSPFAGDNAGSSSSCYSEAGGQHEPADTRSRHARESDILISNLGTQARIEHNELIPFEHRKFQLMACYQESVEYFAKITKAAVISLPQSVRTKLKILPDANVDDHDHHNHHHQQQRIVDDRANNAQAEQQSEAITEPSSLYGHFMHCLQSVDQLAANCLLMLHLEVRVHCFYHLLPLFQLTAFVGSNQQIDQQVIHLNKDLMQMHDALSGFFQPYKLKYIFEGLGHLIAAIFISACQNISRINDAGKKRICRDIYTIQQCLSNLTGEREADLDQARKFYQLLYKSPDDILNSVVENGPEFTLQQYSNLLALAVRSHATLSSEPGALEQRLTRLKNLTNEMRNLEKNKSSTHE
ncbi:Exocyst complex component 4 [Trichinella zimbabwensis]|uniref:Exocyst complex component Sec8 n=1 Tax=Trichinella zimbabwensis TaxID=268475 RepID=A0A0V1HHR9_9BILA|nr:Exocyst complex component 4 [Trichinella zimbabwensis]